MFAVVDVETTGGHAATHAITELALVVYDGREEIARYQSLFNPRRPIPYQIQQLTGIDDNMVADAPFFEDEAPRIWELLENNIFVAHNVNFDYSFVQEAMRRAGLSYRARRLCTVRYARKIIPGLPSYSLGPLTRSLGYSNAAPHRAWGDTDVTLSLLGELLRRDTAGLWQKMLKMGAEGEVALPPHLPKAHYDALPEAPGVYYFEDQSQRPLYIGKAQNLRKRVAQHFGGRQDSARSSRLRRETYHLRFALTGTDWLAEVLEDTEIRRYFPPLNRAQKRRPKRFGLFSARNQNGEGCFFLNEIQGQQGALRVFLNLEVGRSWLSQKIYHFGMDPYLQPFGAKSDRMLSPEKHEAGYQAFLRFLAQRPRYHYLDLPGVEAGERVWVLLQEERLINWRSISVEHQRDTQAAECLSSLVPLAPSPNLEALVRQARQSAHIECYPLPEDFSLQQPLLL